MATVDLAKKRVIDFNPQKCESKNDSVILLSPLDWIEGDILYLPESIRMPDGSINEFVAFDSWAFSRALEEWEGDFLSMYVGKNYLQTIGNWANGYINDREKLISLHLPKVVNIFLYDEEIEGCTSKNGILYCGEEAVFVPDMNPYAECMPLTPVHGMYKDDYSSIDGINLEGCGRDMFGGIYTLDGNSFVRWDGHDFVESYRIRNGVKEIREKAFLGRGGRLSIRRIYLPDTLEKIGREAFMSCGLKPELSLPASVVEIGERAFYDCQSLESVTLSPNLRIIGKEAFRTTGLKKVLIPESVVHIGDKCFDNCWQLSSIIVEGRNMNYSSDDGILYNFEKSVLLRIPPLLFPDSEQNTNPRKEKSEKEIICGQDVIVKFENLFEGINFVTKKDARNGKEFKEIIKNKDKDEPLFPQVLFIDNDNIIIRGWDLTAGCRIYVDDGDFVKSGEVIGIEWEYPMQYYGPSRKEYTIQESVKTLADGALQRSSLQKLIIPKNVECIGSDQFQFCEISEIIVSPENEYYEFRDNSLIAKKSKKLLHWFDKEKDIVIPQGVEIIGERAFDFYGFKSLVIPEGVKCIETHAFWCSIQGYTIYLPSSLCYVATDAFYDLNGQRDSYCEYNIYVPHGLKQKYVKLLGDYYCLSKDIKEIESVPIEVNSEADYKKLAVPTEDDLQQAVTDEYGGMYSKDGKRLLKFGESNIVKDGTEVICDEAGLFSDEVHLPASVKYLGIDSVWANNLIIEGTDTYIAGMDLGEDNTIFIPCGTWAKYHSQIESNLINSPEAQCEIEEYGGYDEFKEKFDKYHMIELSKANVAMYLQQQRDILISLINSTKVLTEHTIVSSLDGISIKNILCFRTANNAFIINRENRHFLYRFADTLLILGYTLQDVCDILQVRISEIEVNEDNIETLVGRTLARRVLKSWMEDFVDEDSGEVVSIKRNEVIFEFMHTIEEDDVQILLDCEIKRVVVYDDYPWSSYTDSCLVAMFSTSEEELCVNNERVLGLLFPGKECDKITPVEKKEMAYNLLVAFQAGDYSGYVEDVFIPLKVKPEEQHSKVTAEENRLINFISEFYDQKINAIMNCKTDLDVMPLFSTDKEMCNQLESFLKDNGVPKGVVNSFVIQFFDALDLE